MNNKKEFEPTLICVYGTLRMGQRNYYGRLDRHDVESLGTYKTKPEFTLYGKNAGFPILVNKGNTSVTYELYSINDKVTMQKINSLEGCTGIPGDPNNWYDLMSIETPKGEAYIYIQNKYKGHKESIITSGDWLNQNKF